MSIPNHSSSCLTRAFKTRCRYCGEEVYYFFCTCGTKLLFESLGPPWPIHYCLDEVEDIIDVITDTYGTVDQSALNRIKIISEERGFELSDESLQKIKSYLRKNDNKQTKKKIQPIEAETLVFGQIMSIRHNINFFKKLKIQETIIGSQLLGNFGKESFAEITLRTSPNQNNEVEEYDIILPEALVRRLQLHEKEKIATKINSQSIAVTEKFWCVEFIDKIK
jgi:hypothetical protein